MQNRHTLRPGDSIELRLAERLENGYDDELAMLVVVWQDRDKPAGQIASKHREVQVDASVGHASGKVGPIVVTLR